MLNHRTLTELIGLVSIAQHEIAKTGDEVSLNNAERAKCELREELSWQHNRQDDWIWRAARLVYEADGKLPAIRLHRRLTGKTLQDSKNEIEMKAHYDGWTKAKP